MFEFDYMFITGFSVGFEFHNSRALHEDMSFAFSVDLGIVRFQIVKWERED